MICDQSLEGATTNHPPCTIHAACTSGISNRTSAPIRCAVQAKRRPSSNRSTGGRGNAGTPPPITLSLIHIYGPDALVNCGPPIPDDDMVAPHPVVIVEVLSPSTTGVDAGGKLADYFRLSSVRHYLLVRPTRREIIHHRRVDDRIETNIVGEGFVELDPLGIRLAIDEVYGAQPKA